MYKIIACDLDETLVGDDSKIPMLNIEAINEAKKLGVKFIPVTGRSHRSILDILETLDLYDKKDEYIISINGGCIVENKDFKILKFINLDFDLAKKIFEIGVSKQLCIHVYTQDDVFIFNINEAEEEYIATRLKGSIKVENNSIEFLRNVPIAKVIFQNLDRDYLISIEEEMNEIIKEEITVTFSSNRYIEFMTLGIDKGVGLLELADKLGIKIDEIMAIGDNFNDLEMLKVAGLSIAVNNAVDEIKEEVDYVCTTNNNQGAVAEAINKFILK